MHYTIRHVTRFTYEAPITESMMEARMQPRSDGKQRCLQFGLSTNPGSRVMMYQDHDANLVHHFNIPGRHARLTVTAEALVECAPFAPLPDRLGVDAWAQLDALTESGEYWEMLNPSSFARPSAALDELAREMNIDRSQDPMSLLRSISADIYSRFGYSQKITRVDSPIDDALQVGSGVCQDFAHIMIALARSIGIPCRYVSGYLFHHANSPDRSLDGATHAWAEAFLPELGWVGFDPTNNLIAGDRHIRVAVGRDYADVPPTRGVFKGKSAVRSELAVAVSVGPGKNQISGESMPFIPWMSREANGIVTESANASQHFQQLQQQQQ